MVLYSFFESGTSNSSVRIPIRVNNMFYNLNVHLLLWKVHSTLFLRLEYNVTSFHDILWRCHLFFVDNFIDQSLPNILQWKSNDNKPSQTMYSWSKIIWGIEAIRFCFKIFNLGQLITERVQCYSNFMSNIVHLIKKKNFNLKWKPNDRCLAISCLLTECRSYWISTK